ncbi:MAG: YgjP-like metallopeptidase domain-containing protein, partial [Pseudomonadota bacterium]
MPVLPGSPPLDITLRRSARAVRFSLRVSALDGRVTLSIPQRAREAEAMAFARQHEDWLRAALARQGGALAIGFGSVLPIEGREVVLAQGTGRAARPLGDSLFLPGAEAQVAARAAAYLRALARDRLAEASEHYAGLLGRKVARITLRDDHVDVVAEWDLFLLADASPTALATASDEALAAARARLQRTIEDGTQLRVDGAPVPLHLTGWP